MTGGKGEAILVRHATIAPPAPSVGMKIAVKASPLRIPGGLLRWQWKERMWGDPPHGPPRPSTGLRTGMGCAPATPAILIPRCSAVDCFASASADGLAMTALVPLYRSTGLGA